MGHWFVYGLKLFQAFNHGYYSNAAELLMEAERGLIQSGISFIYLVYHTYNLYNYGECTTSRRTNCPQTFCEKIFYLYVSFLSLSSIKIVSQKLAILHGLSQKLVTGFFPTVSFMTDAKFLPATLPHSHTLFLCLSRCLPVSSYFRSSINTARVCISDY